ncbi:MAG: sulfatase [Lentisphaerae bacterium]|nr:sulfatase [Lentisphaerota bacterium]MBT4820000.1 sulfatase [Lentisphaerota bacterium]MBT5612290.1 sulfatase [Lentisphaerota bacterium]MBT7060732.1 sulfatase [Lentisphaerota bacterium]MBT7845269.1 sulfatase [Lentisphaerota bacterium]
MNQHGLRFDTDRRPFLRALMAGAALTATVCTRTLAAPPKPEKLNILLIVAEDMGAQLGCYGDVQVKTPRLDQFANEGVRFENAFVTQASCSPSRSSILTGLYPHQNGQLGLAHYGFRIPKGLPNIPRLLKAAGYRTGIMGKLHVNPESEFPFDFRGTAHGKTRDVRATAKTAAEFMGQNGEKPFFLYLNFADAHTPLSNQVAGEPKVPTKAADVIPWPFLGVDTPDLRKRVAGYYNCVRRVDLGVGLTLDALQEAGHAEDTLVIFIGDHGPPFCRGKTTCYEAGLRIPFIVRWPAKSKAGLVSNQLISTIDLLPTIAEAAGAPCPAGLPGESLSRLLTGTPAPWRKTLFAGFTNHGPTGYFPQRSIRDSRYKLIANLLADDRGHPGGPVDGCPAFKLSQTEACTDKKVVAAYKMMKAPPPEELYDLQADPAELTNLAGRPELNEVQTRLRAALQDWRTRTQDPTTTAAGLAALTRFQDQAKAQIKKRIAAGKAKAKKEGRAFRRRDFHRCSQLKATYFVPTAPRETK